MTVTDSVVFDPQQTRTVAAAFERLFPADEHGPGAADIGVVTYLDTALAGAEAEHVATYRAGLAALDQAALSSFAQAFAQCAPAAQDALIARLERDELADVPAAADGRTFFELLRAHLQEGLFADPAYGGNRDKSGWRVLGHPGVWLENSADENLSPLAADKRGVIQSLADLGLSVQSAEACLPGFEPQRTAEPPTGTADVVLVGLGAIGGLIAPILAGAGLRVVALEAGPWRTRQDFVPDELGAAYYCRASMGSKFLNEAPRWRRDADQPTRPATFSLGKMMNGVGGSVIHYGAWLRRFHPHHFRPLTHVRERWGTHVLPTDARLADWPISYADVEPYYTRVEHLVGVAGDETNPFVTRSAPLPMPALRPFRLGEAFNQATAAMGLHPHPVPAGVNSVPYGGRPATTYTAWSNGFGSFTDDKWHPGLSSIPEALATGNFELRTGCRVVRVSTDSSGRANGVEYVAPGGASYFQRARTVILASYTFENIRLMLLSGDERHPRGLGNNSGHVGKYFTTKMFAHVDGLFPDTIFNRHTGPAAQGVVLDDFLSADFDSVAHGFVGGATLGAENQFLPIQISRETLPADVPTWGKGYRDHLRSWQHFGVVRIQPDALPYVTSTVDLDPHHRDAHGLPRVRVTYDLHDNELRLAKWMEARAEEILRAMGATKTWRGPSFTGVGSSHDFGCARMGVDPAGSVLDAELRVHDTPGLYVFGGAALPSCVGINPTLTLWALCYRAAERLVARLSTGVEP